tara:strand:- start:307 stop:474 length:168 start_codon:yes stop_codon:yes gene_type:complete
MSNKKVPSTPEMQVNKDRGLSPASSGTPMPQVKPAAQPSVIVSQSSGRSKTTEKR